MIYSFWKQMELLLCISQTGVKMQLISPIAAQSVELEEWKQPSILIHTVTISLPSPIAKMSTVNTPTKKVQFLILKCHEIQQLCFSSETVMQNLNPNLIPKFVDACV